MQPINNSLVGEVTVCILEVSGMMFNNYRGWVRIQCHRWRGEGYLKKRVKDIVGKGKNEFARSSVGGLYISCSVWCLLNTLLPDSDLVPLQCCNTL